MQPVFRDQWLLVVDKPSGMPTQPQPGAAPDLHTLLRAEHDYVGLHHRLDRPASGLVLFTLHRDANAPIAQAFREHTIARTYVAVLAGDAMSVGDTATWDAPLDGKPAVSRVRILGGGGGMRAAEIQLETGRTHQIRRHAAMAGLPIVGDRRHGGDAGAWWPRLALHAVSLGLTHPLTREPLTLTATIPEDMVQLWTRAGGPAE